MNMQNRASYSTAGGCGLTRRSLLAGAAATAALLAMPMGVTGVAPALADESADAASSDDYQAPDANTEGAVQGGTLNWFIISPSGIEPFSTSENNGVMVAYALFDTLTALDNYDGHVTPLAAESWESNEDATQFTFHLRQDAMFHNGQPVTSNDFKYAWERICRADFKPAPSTQGSIISLVQGAKEMQAGEATELGVQCPDDYTFVVNLTQPFADFPIITTHPSTAPVPAGCTDTEEDFQAFSRAPIGNGPFQMDGEWVNGQYINVKRFEGYTGERPNIDAISFRIFIDADTAWTEFQAGNLDFTLIPNGMYTASTAMYGTADADGNLANPGKQVYSGMETTSYCIICNLEDATMSNKDLRIALSYAGSEPRGHLHHGAGELAHPRLGLLRRAALPGYQENAWDHCPAAGDKQKAAEYLDKAGYPADESGNRNLTLTLTTNTGSGNEDIFTMIQADLMAVGINAEIQTQEWAAYLDALNDGSYQMGRMGYTADAPTAYFFMQDAFAAGAGSNYSKYSNPDFEAALAEAVAQTDEEARIAGYQAADKILAEDFPLIPLCYYTHGYVTSARVNNMFMNPMGFVRYNRCWLSA